jgi:signal transduction histidine kinase
VKGLEQQLTAQNHPLAASAAKVAALLEEATNRTHDLASEFTTLSAEGKDLVAALRQLTVGVERTFGIKCALHENTASPSLPEHATMHLYKICQEAVSNAIKHGKARNVAIRLSNEGSNLRLAIENDGAPISGPASKQRLGLRIMRYRANSIGATLDIRPMTGKGTVVSCSVPVERPASRPPKRSIRSSAQPVAQ